MDKYSKISELMKRDWNRRVKHDYRFWMSDGRTSDSEMWESGKRDFELLCSDIDNREEKVLLELGCGVGRLLHAALGRFKKVIGIDVSSQAIEKARELLPPLESLELIAGNGVDLQPVPDKSVDVLISFAAITSIPTEVIANYLREIQRVLKDDGTCRLQVYIGREQPVHDSDTLHIRCFEEENFKTAVRLAGFQVEVMEELVLPFQVSYEEVGFKAVKVVLKKSGNAAAIPEIIARGLLPAGEKEAPQGGDDDLEYWMSVNYAKELVDEGDLDKARETLEYALAFSKTTTIDVRDLLDQIGNKLTGPAAAEKVTGSKEPQSNFEKNIAVLKRRFPEVYEIICAVPEGESGGIEIRDSAEGPVVFIGQQCLDHADKPVASGQVWAKRAIKEAGVGECEQLAVYGFASGYHIEALLELADKKVAVIEPHAAVFKKVLEHRDLSQCLLGLTALSVGEQASLDCIDENSELIVRPQTQMTALDYHQKVRSYFYSARGIKSIKPRMAVLGPLQGGTLPILTYTMRALLMERQRVRDIDMSVFAGAYHAISDVIAGDLMQLSAQGRYVETLAKIALDSITEKPVDILICMAQAPVTIEMLEELRKRGILRVLWFVEDYQRFKTWEMLAPHFDFIFTIQKGECIEAIKAAGCPEVHYLPTACDPFIHTPVELTEKDKERWGSPISFMGAGYHNRQQMFASLANLPFKIWGTEWPTCKPFDKLVQESGRRLKPEEYVKIFNSTDININLHSSTERDGVDPNGDFLNPRTFELAAIGAFQLVDERKLLPEAFEVGKEIVTFKNTEDLKAKIAYYLEHADERRQIAENARARAHRDHTYQQRLKEMLSIIYSSQFERLKSRVDQEPWTKLLERSKPFPELHKRCQVAFERGEQPTLDALVSDIVTGQGSLTETEGKLLFLFHVSKQIIRMRQEEQGDKNSL